MKLLEINSCSGCLSTGRIAANIAEEFLKKSTDNEAVIAYARDFRDCGIKTYKIGSASDVYMHKLSSLVFDNDGFCSVSPTKKFLNWASEYDPDILWLHNIHGFYLNVELLFRWIKERPQMKVLWTLHDCWAFTGHCTFFTLANCDKWKTECHKCTQKTGFPPCYFFDKSDENYKRKKELFTGVSNLTIIAPSKWMASLVKESFLKEYPVEIRYNTVDASVFRYTDSSFARDNGLEEKKIVLGVANPWSDRKGLNDFIRLQEHLDDTYKIVLVGVSKKQKALLSSDRFLTFERTNSPRQLAEIYSAADVFVNPTYEDNYPTTNIEAAACGTKVITYNTGGSPESAEPENVVPVGDIPALADRIIGVCRERS